MSAAPSVEANQADLRAPMSAGEAASYQRLRSHLATLRLAAAAESLTAVLDLARAENLSVITTLERLLGVGVDAAVTAGTPACCALPAYPPPTRSATSTSPRNPAWTPN